MAGSSVEQIAVRAFLLAERLDTRVLEREGTLALAPLVVPYDDGGVAIVFRYGAAVLFEGSAESVGRFIARLEPLLIEKFVSPELEEFRVFVRADADQPVDTTGNIVLRDRATERLQMVADVLAKNLVLAHYERRAAAIFDRIEPLAVSLRVRGRASVPGRELLQHIGDVLLIQQKMVGRVETGEKPELVWEHFELDRIYMRLADEFELRERGRAIDQKLEIVWRTVETVLRLEQTRSSLRVEWYIVALIVAELVIAAYPLLAALRG